MTYLLEQLILDLHKILSFHLDVGPSSHTCRLCVVGSGWLVKEPGTFLVNKC